VSRIGNTPINFGDKTSVTLKDDVITVKGPKATLERTIHPMIDVEIGDKVINIKRKDETRKARVFTDFSECLSTTWL